MELKRPPSGSLKHYFSKTEDGYPYLWITFPKTAVYEMYPGPSNTTAQIDLMRKMVLANQYDLIELPPRCQQ